MKQILQNLGTGETLLEEVPSPGVPAGGVLIASRASLVSLGTERMLVEFGKSNLWQKARKQPDKVRQVLEKIRTDGLFPTLEAVRAKLDQPLPLGYCNAGVVVGVGAGGREADGGGLQVGDHVVSNGPHAEFVTAPFNLCARIPPGVPFEHAAFTVAGSIGLQGVRLLAPTLGETIVVTGLGLIGLLCVQILRANGCQVLGIDFDPAKCALARGFGARTVDLSQGEIPVTAAHTLTGGRGVDGVLVTASTSSSQPMAEAAQMCRQRGRIVLVGVTGLELSRADFYAKELTFQVSCSYGPGRYDASYEQHGRDYPIGFVRWTEQRNFEAFLQLLAEGRLAIDPLISHRFAFAKALDAYRLVADGQGLGIVLDYGAGSTGDSTGPVAPRTIAHAPAQPAAVPDVVVGWLGAGGFSGQVLLPALARTGVRLRTIVSTTGVTARHLGRKFGFEQSSTEASGVLADPAVNVVVVATRHDSHARYVVSALESGKAVYVEKPLCLHPEELTAILAAHQRAPRPFLMVGFNRRFAPSTVTVKRLLAARREPKVCVMLVNAGHVPATHWAHDPGAGGGRIAGEACHFIDLLRHIVGCPIAEAHLSAAGEAGRTLEDVATLQLRFTDGSLGTIHYLANGSKAFPKERLEIFCGGGILQLDNFRTLRGFGWAGFRQEKLWRQDKGHAGEMSQLVAALRAGSGSPIPLEEIQEVTEVTLALAAGQSFVRAQVPSTVGASPAKG